uniref:RdRp catalytic domain-containing protein n=1 Tax=Trichuris muris TaxID=70415 RepID=A0A5S6QRM0_TRIMR
MQHLFHNSSKEEDAMLIQFLSRSLALRFLNGVLRSSASGARAGVLAKVFLVRTVHMMAQRTSHEDIFARLASYELTQMAHVYALYKNAVILLSHTTHVGRHMGDIRNKGDILTGVPQRSLHSTAAVSNPVCAMAEQSDAGQLIAKIHPKMGHTGVRRTLCFVRRVNPVVSESQMRHAIINCDACQSIDSETLPQSIRLSMRHFN